jgi:hypothetical protein
VQDLTAVGVGSRGEHIALWAERILGGSEQLVTWHGADGEPERTVVVASSLAGPRFVQPTPDGGVLIASARKARGAAISAQRWNAAGELVAQGDFGDGVEHVLVTESGKVWVGYFDEALTGRTPEGHGLVRFGVDLKPEWLYPWQTQLRPVDDCESMNVVGETVYICPYSDHHVIAVSGQEAKDLGPSPHRGAVALLVEGTCGVLIGGYGADYDLVTPFEFAPDGPRPVGGQGRLVMPDGMEVQRVSWSCRGDQAWAQIGNTRYRLTVSQVFDALC